MLRILSTVFCFIVLISCSRFNLRAKINRELDKAITLNNGKVSFNAIDEDFDSLMILRPYSNIETIEKNLSLDLNEIKITNIHYREDIILFVLFKQRKVIEFAGINRDKFSYSEAKPKVYSKNHIFILKKVNTNESGYFVISD